ncbi:MAG: serine acetyltransferase [Deltaproteobacteria bacterium]|nr:serine acetyltransferase [Deltaproteobacteria bacterium]
MTIFQDKATVDETKEGGLSALVDSLCVVNNGFSGAMRRNHHNQPLPSRDVIIDVVEALRSVLFPGYFGFSGLSADSVHFHVGAVLDRIRPILEKQIKRGLCFSCSEDMFCCPVCDNRAQAVTSRFFARLPDIQRMLVADVQASYEGDPATSSPDEVIFCYPGLLAITNYRLAHELHRQEIPLIPRMITECAHSATGIDIHPGASIGNHFFIDHGTGVVIGETCVIGDRVRIYQGVTLGAKSFKLDEEGKPVKGIPRHPVVEDDVTIYSGATILGRVTIGRGSVIGGNVWLVESVPPYSHISQAEARQMLYENGDGI